MKLSVFNLLVKHQRLDEALHAEQLRKHPDAAREPAIAHWLNTGSPVAAH